MNVHKKSIKILHNLDDIIDCRIKQNPAFIIILLAYKFRRNDS